MKYYAVTEDPNELFHYGVKGMKWGKHLFGDEPKSPGYKRAASKLRASLKSSASNTSKAKAGWKSISSTLGEKLRKRQETKFENAVKAAQDRVKKNELLFAKNEIKQQEKASKQAYKDLVRSQKESAREAKDIQKYRSQIGKIQRMAELSDFKASMKQDSKASKAEKHMDKYMQEAREGRLKYGKLTDEQVERVTERLALENQARRLGGTENPKFTKDLKSALRQGILSGVASGTSTAMNEIARAKVQNVIGKRTLIKNAKNQAKASKEANRIRNKRTHREVKEDLKQELYEQEVRAGVRPLERTFTGNTAAGIGKKLMALDDAKNERYRQRRIDDEIQSNNDRAYAKLLQITGDDDINDFNQRRTRDERNEYVREKLTKAYNEFTTNARLKEQNDAAQSKYEKELESWENKKRKSDNEQAEFLADQQRYKQELAQYTKDMINYRAALAQGRSAIPPEKPKPPKHTAPPLIFNDPKPNQPMFRPVGQYDLPTYLMINEIGGLPNPYSNNNKKPKNKNNRN